MLYSSTNKWIKVRCLVLSCIKTLITGKLLWNKRNIRNVWIWKYHRTITFTECIMIYKLKRFNHVDFYTGIIYYMNWQTGCHFKSPSRCYSAHFWVCSVHTNKGLQLSGCTTEPREMSEQLSRVPVDGSSLTNERSALRVSDLYCCH